VIEFTLPFALPSLNVRDRRHRYQHGKDKKQMHLEVLAAIGGSRYLPREPLERARITVVRHSSGQIDPDGVASTCKNLLDVLCVKSKVHPTGLGFIVDDDAKHIELHVSQESAPKGQGSTLVRIEAA
jgi:hypothetical protein